MASLSREKLEDNVQSYAEEVAAIRKQLVETQKATLERREQDPQGSVEQDRVLE